MTCFVQKKIAIISIFYKDILNNSLAYYVNVHSYSDKKEKKKFPRILGNSEGSGAKSYMTNDLLIYSENICAFPHIQY